MPYTIHTEDGIVLEDIPDNIPQDSQQLKDRVAQIRAQNNSSKPGAFGQYQKSDGSWENIPGPQEQNVDSPVSAIESTDVVKKDPGFIERVKNMFTGEDRMTPEMEHLSSIGSMPELNNASIASFKSALNSMTNFNDEETAQALQANFPGLQIRKDEKGNLIAKSSINGQDYVINKPGLDTRDIIKGALTAAIFGVGAPEKIGASMAMSAAKQAGIEGIQSGTGGEFNPGAVAVAGASELVAPAMSGVMKSGGRFGQAAGEAAGSRSVQPLKDLGSDVVNAFKRDIPIEQMGAQEFGQTLREGDRAFTNAGKQESLVKIASQVNPDEEIFNSAKRLGIEDYLQPDHLTTNQAYRQMAQAAKSVPGSKSKVLQDEGLMKIAERADNLISELGGTDDLSQLNFDVKSRMEKVQGTLKEKADQLYTQLRKNIKPETSVYPKNTLDFLGNRIRELGGYENLTPVEKTIYSRLNIKKSSSKFSPSVGDEGELVFYKPSSGKKITYANLDDSKKYVGKGMNNSLVFPTQEQGILKKLYSNLSLDQNDIAEYLGQSESLNKAKSIVSIRKSIEDDMKSLFGRSVDNSLIQPLITGVQNLSKGDSSKFVKLVKAIPEDMRKQTVASGLSVALGKNSKNNAINFNNYAQWYEGLKRNGQAYTALVSNLPPQARGRLNDLYKVSKAVNASAKEYIGTGRLNTFEKIMNGSDNLISNVYDAARKSVKKAAINEAAGAAFGVHGVGTVGAIAHTLTEPKNNALKLADDLISSEEFINAAKNIGTENQIKSIRKLSFSKTFKEFAKERRINDKEKWINAAIKGINSREDQDGSNE